MFISSQTVNFKTKTQFSVLIQEYTEKGGTDFTDVINQISQRPKGFSKGEEFCFRFCDLYFS